MPFVIAAFGVIFFAGLFNRTLWLMDELLEREEIRNYSLFIWILSVLGWAMLIAALALLFADLKKWLPAQRQYRDNWDA